MLQNQSDYNIYFNIGCSIGIMLFSHQIRNSCNHNDIYGIVYDCNRNFKEKEEENMVFKKTVAKTLAAVALKMAEKACGTASIYGLYRPIEPKALKKLKNK